MTVTRLTSAADELFDDAVVLFDQYRQHYGANPAPDAVALWMRELVSGDRMGLYLDTGARGLCSVAVAPASLTLRTAWLVRDLYVHPDHRRRGVARALLERVAADAREAGAHRLSLQTETANVQAAKLYARNGFTALTDVTVMDRVLFEGVPQPPGGR